MKMTTAELKDALTQKMARQNTVQGIPAASEAKPDTRVEHAVPTLTVSFNFTFPAESISSSLEQIQTMMATIASQVVPPASVYPAMGLSGRPQTSGPVLVQAVSPATKPEQQPQPPLSPSPQSGQQRQQRSSTGNMPMTDKQRAMILALTAKRKMSAEVVQALLQQEFGHSDGAKLTKVQASKLIDKLMAGK